MDDGFLAAMTEWSGWDWKGFDSVESDSIGSSFPRYFFYAWSEPPMKEQGRPSKTTNSSLS
jgi:hypothetical protein